MALMSALAASNTAMDLRCPPAAATIRGVQPSLPVYEQKHH